MKCTGMLYCSFIRMFSTIILSDFFFDTTLLCNLLNNFLSMSLKFLNFFFQVALPICFADFDER